MVFLKIKIATLKLKPIMDLINNIEENILLIENEKAVADLNSGLGIALYTIRNNESALKHLENARKRYKKMGVYFWREINTCVATLIECPGKKN